MMQSRMAVEIFPVKGRAIFRYFRVGFLCTNCKSSACNQEIEIIFVVLRKHASFDFKRKPQLLSYFCQNFRIPSWPR